MLARPAVQSLNIGVVQRQGAAWYHPWYLLTAHEQSAVRQDTPIAIQLRRIPDVDHTGFARELKQLFARCGDENVTDGRHNQLAQIILLFEVQAFDACSKNEMTTSDVMLPRPDNELGAIVKPGLGFNRRIFEDISTLAGDNIGQSIKQSHWMHAVFSMQLQTTSKTRPALDFVGCEQA